MSSGLFGRGTHTQVGGAARAEQVNRELMEIRRLLTEVAAVPEIVKGLQVAVSEMKSRLDNMNIPTMEPQVTRDELSELETRIEALKVLQAPQVTAASLQSMERRIDAKLQALSKKMGTTVTTSEPSLSAPA